MITCACALRMQLRISLKRRGLHLQSIATDCHIFIYFS